DVRAHQRFDELADPPAADDGVQPLVDALVECDGELLLHNRLHGNTCYYTYYSARATLYFPFAPGQGAGRELPRSVGRSASAAVESRAAPSPPRRGLPVPPRRGPAMRGPLAIAAASLLVSPLAAQTPLPGTKPLTAEGDLAAQMVAGIDKYLMREIAASVEKRKEYWKPDFSSPEAYPKSVQPNRERLARILGVVDKRLPVHDLEYVSTTRADSLVAETDRYRVYAVRWPVLRGVDAEGLLLEPRTKPRACVVALPDADWTPEMLVGLAPGVPKESQFARRLAES